MINNKENPTPRQYTCYLVFMLIACSGALTWQLCIPHLAGTFSSWGIAYGWQREIALWNIGIITSIIYALVKRNMEFMKILTIQSTVLCWVLGINHLVALLIDFSFTYILHILGILEVMLLGGIWGAILLIRSKDMH